MGWQQLLEEKTQSPELAGILATSGPVHPVVQTHLCATGTKKKDGYTLQLGLDVIPGTSTPASLLHHGPKGNSDCTQEA